MASDEKPTSIWKKEISFRRKPEGEGAATVEPGEPSSIWKKEISLRKKAKADGPVEPVALEPVEEPVSLDPVSADPVSLDPVSTDPVPAAPADPILDAALAALGVSPAPAEPAPAAAEPVVHDWLTQPLEEVSEPPAELAAEPVEPVAQIPVAEIPVAEIPIAEIPGARVPEPREPEPVPAPAPVAPAPAEAPTAILPQVQVEAAWPGEEEAEPVATAEGAVAAVEEPAAERVPFYKRELSFGRGAKAPKPPKEPKQPKQPKAPKATKPKRDRPEAPGGEAPAKVPFYKRDLSFGKKREWDPGEAVSEAPAPKERKPRSRPSLSLPSFELPSLSRGGGGSAKGRYVGLKIGGSQIAAARIHNGDEPELVQAARMDLEHGIVVNGELRDPEALAVALKDFFTRNKLPKRGVRLGIANNRIGVRTFDVTGIDDVKQLANAIRFRAQEVLPIPLEEAVLDYQVLSEGTTDEGEPLRRVLLVVAYRELVDRYVYACRKAGLQIVGIDLEAFALLRAVAPPQDTVIGGERGALVAVSVGHDRSTFAVSDGRVCEFTRVLEWGGWALNVAIARALDLAPSEAEPLKRALSFAGASSVPAGFDEVQLQTAREAAGRQLQTFARELVSSLQFYQNQPGSLGIGEIALTGGTAHLPGLGAELERLIGVPVRVVDPLNRLKVSKKAREQAQVGSLAVAIGLGIED
jgi:type IV pilus assembly protein PilM